MSTVNISLKMPAVPPCLLRHRLNFLVFGPVELCFSIRLFGFSSGVFNIAVGLSRHLRSSSWFLMHPWHVVVSLTEEPDKFDNDFNDSESEDEDDGGEVETSLRKNERAAKVGRVLCGT